MFRVLSLGAGVQSSTLALMYSLGYLKPMPDAGIFADTKGEPKAVYDWLKFLQSTVRFPIHIVSKGNLWQSATNVRTTRDGERTYIETAIPVFTVDGLKKGKGNRHCTRDFKIKAVQKKVRELINLKRVNKRTPVLVEMAIGISTDEAHRMKSSRETWIKNTYPLIDASYSRQDCIDWMRFYYSEPPRSACTYCPFRSDEQWMALTKEEFDDAVQKEKQLQNAYSRASELDSVPFLHSSRVPLNEVKFKIGHGIEELNKFGNECEGMCGV
jgi:hypothetical protein